MLGLWLQTSLAVSILVISYGALGLLHLVNTDFSSPNAVSHICLELFSVCSEKSYCGHCHSNQIRDGMSAWAPGHGLFPSVCEASADPHSHGKQGLSSLPLTKQA